MVSVQELLKRVDAQEKRIKSLERKVRSQSSDSGFGDFSSKKKEEKSVVKSRPSRPNVSFNQVITVIGVLGIIIAAISFLNSSSKVDLLIE